jgi:hypothetical protein
MACRARCTIDHPVGTASDVSALSACLAAKCENECSLACGALAGYAVEPDAAAACQSCYTTNACSEERTCATSLACDAITRCDNACRTLDCDESCDLRHGVNPAFFYQVDAGDAVYVPFSNVHAGVCASACADGNYWECVGKVSWPAPESATTKFQLTVIDYVTGMTVPGMDVSVCGFADQTCISALAVGTTDASGAVSLSFPNMANVAGQLGLGVNVYLQVTSPNNSIVPLYAYWGFPMSSAQVFSYGNVLTPAEMQQQWAAVNVTQDPTRGVVGVAVYDCEFNSASRVRVTLSTADSQTRAFMPAGVESGITDQTGVLVFTNVPVGTFELTATPMAIRTPSTKVNATARAGGLTQVVVYPTPL